MSTYTSEPGTRLGGRYRLEDRIAAASGWAAWKAIDEILARAVTVFTFAPGFPRIREVVTAARAASRLTDARLTQVFDVEDDWDHAYIVMEWATGDTIDDLLSLGPLEPARGARIVAEAAAALSIAHAAGLAHLCLTPESLRWTQGGGVKVVGLGIHAALAGIAAEEPALADTQGLGRVLYAALTGHWPGPDYPGLPAAPLADGHPRSPRQVRAGVPASLDDITCQAMQLRGRNGSSALTTPGQLAAALSAVIPPTPVPPAPPPSRAVDTSQQGFDQTGEGDYWQGQQPAPARPRPRDQRPRDRQPRDNRRPRDRQPLDNRQRRDRQPRRRADTSKAVRTGVIVALILLVMTGVVAATSPLWHRTSSTPPSKPTHSASPRVSSVVGLAPVSASGFHETSTGAGMAIDQSSRTAWDTQWYRGNPVFGGLRQGSGLMLDMGKTVTLSSVKVLFGPIPGADVQIMLGNTASPQVTGATVSSFTTVGTATNVSSDHLFTVSSTASGRYLLIWFTKLPPLAGSVGKSQADSRYEAKIFNIIVRGRG
jgi:serine/threonine protein kinase